jgi:hypothetical protein
VGYGDRMKGLVRLIVGLVLVAIIWEIGVYLFD